jgi:LacI family transcriptional regulator
VISDNTQGMKDALDYLYSLGHRKIGFVAASPFTSVIAERLECYNHFIKKHSLQAASVQISSRPSEEGGYEGGMIHLQSAGRPTALMCGNDITAVGVMKAARKLRIKIPQQLSIVGYDDIELARHLSPSLTTISQPTETMAAMAVEILLARMKNTAGDARRQVVLPPALVVRESASRV